MLTTLYPTDTSAPLYAEGDVELTQYIQNISGIELGDDIAKSYYMGYLPQDSFPESVFGITSPRLSADQKTLYLNNFVKENRPWGYCWFYDYGSNNIEASFQAYYFNSSNQLTRYRTANWANVRLVNKITMANVSLQDKISLTMKFRIVPTANLDENGTGRAVQTVDYSETTNLEGLRKFVNGQASFTCSISQSYVSTTKVLNYSDFDENTMTCHYTEGDYEVYVILYSFRIYSGQLYKKRDGTSTYQINILPFFRTHIPDGVGLPEQDAFVVGYNYGDIAIDSRYQTASDSDEKFMQDSPGVPYCYGSDAGHLTYHFYRGKYPFDSINMEDVPFLAGSGSGIIKNCMYIDSASGTGKTFIFYPCMDFKDVLKAVMLRNCVQTNHSSFNSLTLQDTYDSDMYVSYFNGDDIPYFDNMPITLWGAVGDSALDSGILRPWQEPGNDITANEFDVDDMPEYNPPTPEDDDSKSSGVDYTPNTAFAIDTASGFVTQYVLTPSQLGNFGQYLWANMFDEDFLDSIMVSLGESLSVDPSNILKYIVSVRYFPFSFSNRYGMSLIHDTIYIGRGVKGIELNSGSQIGLFDSYCEDIDGGYADVPYPERIGQDFRAYEPCTSVHVIVPFCGVVELTPSQAIGSRIHLKYCVDFSTGAIQAAVSIINDTNYIAAILNGNIGATVELSASNLVQVLQKGVSVATSVVKGAAMLAVGAEAAGAGAAMTDEAAIESSQMMAQGASEAGKGITNLATLEGVAPTTCSMSSGFSSFHVTKPIVRVTHKHYEIPNNYGHAVGYACNKTVTLGSLEGKGFTVCKNVDLTGVPATQDELIALEKLLQSGVYL